MSITIHDLARLAGLNPSTVSRALRNDPRVRTSTRERITSLAAEHGYIPNLNARNLADGKTRMIALLMGSLEFPVEREAAVRLNAPQVPTGRKPALRTGQTADRPQKSASCS